MADRDPVLAPSAKGRPWQVVGGEHGADGHQHQGGEKEPHQALDQQPDAPEDGGDNEEKQHDAHGSPYRRVPRAFPS